MPRNYQEHLNQLYNQIQDNMIYGEHQFRTVRGEDMPNGNPTNNDPNSRLTITATDSITSGTITVPVNTTSGQIIFAADTSSNLGSWQLYDQINPSQFQYRFYDSNEKKEDQFDFISYESVSYKANRFQGGIFLVKHKYTPTCYLSHTSCILEGVAKYLKRIKMGQDVNFNKIEEVEVKILYYSDSLTDRLINLHKFSKVISKTKGFKLVNRTDGLVLKPYTKIYRMRPCLYLRNRAGDMFIVGVFKDMKSLNSFKQKHYPNDEVTTVVYHEHDKLNRWLDEKK